MVWTSFWPLLAGEASACSNELCSPSVLIAPLNPAAFKGCSDGVGSSVRHLSLSPVPSPQPWSSAQHRGTRDRQWQTRSLQPPAPNHLLQSSAFLPRVGRAFPVLQHGVTRCQPMAQGSPCRAPSCLLPHGAPGVNAHPSIPHPLAPRTQPPLGPPVSPNPALDPPRLAQLRGRTEKRAQGVHVVAKGGKPV